jgi:methanogenic corrinoid protein MtbC1
MPEVIDLLEKKGLRKNTKIIVGGASVNAQFAELIKADGYAPEANSAYRLVKQLIKG